MNHLKLLLALRVACLGAFVYLALSHAASGVLVLFLALTLVFTGYAETRTHARVKQVLGPLAEPEAEYVPAGHGDLAKLLSEYMSDQAALAGPGRGLHWVMSPQWAQDMVRVTGLGERPFGYPVTTGDAYGAPELVPVVPPEKASRGVYRVIYPREDGEG